MARILVDPIELESMAALLADAAAACAEIAAAVAGAVDCCAPAAAAAGEAIAHLRQAGEAFRSEAAGLHARCRCCERGTADGGPGLWALAADAWGAPAGAPAATTVGGAADDATTRARLSAALTDHLARSTAAPAAAVVVGGEPIAAFAGLGQPSGSWTVANLVTTNLAGAMGALAAPSPVLGGALPSDVATSFGLGGSARSGGPASGAAGSWNGLQDPTWGARVGTGLGGLSEFLTLSDAGARTHTSS